MGNCSVSAAAKLLFLRHTLEGKDWQLDVWGYRHFTQQDALPIPGFDSVSCHGGCGEALTVLSELFFVLCLCGHGDTPAFPSLLVSPQPQSQSGVTAAPRET